MFSPVWLRAPLPGPSRTGLRAPCGRVRCRPERVVRAWLAPRVSALDLDLESDEIGGAVGPHHEVGGDLRDEQSAGDHHAHVVGAGDPDGGAIEVGREAFEDARDLDSRKSAVGGCRTRSVLGAVARRGRRRTVLSPERFGARSLGGSGAEFFRESSAAGFDPGAELGGEVVEVAHDAGVERRGAFVRRHLIELVSGDDPRSGGHVERLPGAAPHDSPDRQMGRSG